MKSNNILMLNYCQSNYLLAILHVTILLAVTFNTENRIPTAMVDSKLVSGHTLLTHNVNK